MAKGPAWVDLPSGEHKWCGCGRELDPPLCQGKHEDCQTKGVLFTIEAAETSLLCGCGLSQKPPFCDGSHTSLGSDGFDEYL